MNSNFAAASPLHRTAKRLTVRTVPWHNPSHSPRSASDLRARNMILTCEAREQCPKHHLTQPRHDRGDLRRGAPHPERQGGTLEDHALPRQDLRLAITCCTPDYDVETTPLP